MKAYKVCMLGDFAVGKTSLVTRFVHACFSTKYLTTVGVKIDTKVLPLEHEETAKLVLWDLAGSDNLAALQKVYLRGASGYILVADGTRQQTLETAQRLDQAAQQMLGKVPRILLVNKSDLETHWEVASAQMTALATANPERPCYRCSALNGEQVERALTIFANRLAGY